MGKMTPAHGWIDGVPLELRPRYYPKPPLRFKDIDIYIPLEAIENDYDFTEERRVLTDCKIWEEEMERRRLKEEEEERRRMEEEELKLQEKLKLEEEEEIERLVKEAETGLDNSSDSDAPLSDEDKTEDPPISQEAESLYPVPPLIQPHSTSNGYNYVMGSDIRTPMMYQQTGQNYYNYFMQRLSEPVAPITPIFTSGQQTLPQPIACSIPPVPLYQSQSPTFGPSGGDVISAVDSHDAHSTPYSYPAATTTTNMNGAASSFPQYPSANISASGGTAGVHPGTCLQSHDAHSTPVGSPYSYPTTTSATNISDAAHLVPQYPSANISASGGSALYISVHSGAGLQSQEDAQSTQVGSLLPLQITTSTSRICDAAPVTSSAFQYQSANASTPRDNRSNHSGSESPFVQPTQAVTQQPPNSPATLGRESSRTEHNSTDNSFTKFNFPFLTSMTASSRPARDHGVGYISSSFSHPFLAQSTSPRHQYSSNDIASQNPFLSSYVQSRPPMQSNQYWTTGQLLPQLFPYPQQSQNLYGRQAPGSPSQIEPAQYVMGASINFIPNSGPIAKSNPQTPTGSQHVLR